MMRSIARQVLPLIDLTSLGDDDTQADIDALCNAAKTPFGNVAAVCVWPRFVPRAVANVSALDISVAGVANFPEGENDADRAVADALEVVEAGGLEVDVVYPWRSLRDGDGSAGSHLIRQVRDSMPDHTLLKVILETGELAEPDLIRAAARDAIAGGADFLKTSTGKTDHSATPDAVELLCKVVRAADRRVGIKVSGGVRTVRDAIEYLEIAEEMMGMNWIKPSNFRIGASSLLDDVVTMLSEA